MELNITRFFNDACPMDYSASVAEIGANAGRDTWQAACDDSDDFMLLDDEEKREAFRVHVRCFGAWSDEEIAAWSDKELNALCIQMVSGEIRECEKPPHESSSRIYQTEDGQVYYYVGE